MAAWNGRLPRAIAATALAIVGMKSRKRSSRSKKGDVVLLRRTPRATVSTYEKACSFSFPALAPSLAELLFL